MERDHYFIIATWREGDVDIVSLQEEQFLFARTAWIGQGHTNLQSEWFVRRIERERASGRFESLEFSDSNVAERF